MKTLISAMFLWLLFASLASGEESLRTTIVTERRIVVVEIDLPSSVVVAQNSVLSVVVGKTDAQSPADPLDPLQNPGPADPHGPPQNFALDETGFKIGSNRYRISVALPLEKVPVKFIILDRNEVILSATREL